MDKKVFYNPPLKKSLMVWAEGDLTDHEGDDKSAIDGQDDKDRQENISEAGSDKDADNHKDGISQASEQVVLYIIQGALLVEDHKDKEGSIADKLKKVADHSNNLSLYDDMFKSMKQSNTSWIDLFYQMDIDRNGKVSSYEVYVHLSRDMKLSKKASMGILRKIDFNEDGYATIEEWMKYESELPKELKVNAVYQNKGDFLKRLVQSMEEHGENWESIFKNSLEQDMTCVPTKILMDKMVNGMHLSKVNTRQLLQDIDSDTNGVITEADWMKYFKEEDLQDEKAKELLLEEEDVILATTADMANLASQDYEQAGKKDNFTFGIANGLSRSNQQSDLNGINSRKEESFGVPMPIGEYVLYVESDLKELKDSFDFMKNLGALNGIRDFSDTSPQNLRDKQNQLASSPTAKGGILSPAPSDPKFNVDSIRPVATKVDSVFGDDKVSKSPPKFSSYMQSGDNQQNSAEKGMDNIMESENIDENGGLDDFSPNAEARQEALLDGFDEASVGYERSFTQESVSDDSNISPSVSFLTESICFKTILTTHEKQKIEEKISEILATISMPKSELPLAKLISQVHIQVPELSRKLITSLFRALDTKKTGFVSHSSWKSFKSNFAVPLQTLLNANLKHISSQALSNEVPTSPAFHIKALSLSDMQEAASRHASDQASLIVSQHQNDQYDAAAAGKSANGQTGVRYEDCRDSCKAETMANVNLNDENDQNRGQSILTDKYQLTCHGSQGIKCERLIANTVGITKRDKSCVEAYKFCKICSSQARINKEKMRAEILLGNKSTKNLEVFKVATSESNQVRVASLNHDCIYQSSTAIEPSSQAESVVKSSKKAIKASLILRKLRSRREELVMSHPENIHSVIQE